MRIVLTLALRRYFSVICRLCVGLVVTFFPRRRDGSQMLTSNNLFFFAERAAGAGGLADHTGSAATALQDAAERAASPHTRGACGSAEPSERRPHDLQRRKAELGKISGTALYKFNLLHVYTSYTERETEEEMDEKNE